MKRKVDALPQTGTRTVKSNREKKQKPTILIGGMPARGNRDTTRMAKKNEEKGVREHLNRRPVRTRWKRAPACGTRWNGIRLEEKQKQTDERGKGLYRR